MKEMELVTRAVASILLGCAMPAGAEIYQWTDRDGHVHYGDAAAKAQEPARPAAKLEIGESAGPIDPAAERNRQQLRELHRKYDEQRAVEARALDTSQQRNQRRQDYCNHLRNSIRYDQEVAVVFRYDDAGNRVFLNAAERAAQSERLLDAQRQYCEGAD